MKTILISLLVEAPNKRLVYPLMNSERQVELQFIHNNELRPHITYPNLDRYDECISQSRNEAEEKGGEIYTVVFDFNRTKRATDPLKMVDIEFVFAGEFYHIILHWGK